eukprot:jgi/Pico_ML_1/50775/g1924.t1
MTQFLAEVMNKAGLGVMEIHSRKSQSYRTKVASTFRTVKEGILLSSDVSARGMDYPDVTAVVQVEKALSGVPFQLKSQAYQAWLGFYNSNLKQMRWDKPTLVQEANKWCIHAGLSSPPPLQKSTISKMGLKGVPGLVVGPPSASHQGGRRRP